MNKRLRILLGGAVLLMAVLVLSGCVAPTGPVDLDKPQGTWEAIVFALSKFLILLNETIAGLRIPFSWGWAIIVFTLAMKIVTLPLTLKQLQSMKAQQALQPRLRELQEKYGKDRQKLSEEQMKLYREAGVSPLGGCLPLLIQFPILFALYQALYALANSGHLTNAPFFWIPDLSYPSLTVGTGWIGTSFAARDWKHLIAYLSLPILMLLTQLLLQKMSQAPKDPKGGKPDPQTAMMGQMMYLMPIMFFYFTLGFPSGLTLYWTATNVLSMIQQYFVTRWGALGDWFPFLRNPQLAPAAVTMTEVAPATPVAPDRPEKPVKRKRRRK